MMQPVDDLLRMPQRILYEYQGWLSKIVILRPRRRVSEEIEFEKELIGIRGALEMLFATSS